MKRWVVLFIALFLVSCNSNPSFQTVTGTPEAYPNPNSGTNSYPYPVGGQTDGISTAYPVTEQNNAAPADNPSSPRPTIDNSLGIIKGRLLDDGNAVGNVDLYLAELLVNPEGKGVVFSFSHDASPHARTNENGEFEFVNVPLGTYGIVLDNVFQSVLLLNPETNDQMKFDVEAGSEIDLGDLNYSGLPTD